MTTSAKDFKVKNGLQVGQGGSFGGAVVVGTPTSETHATTKTYVDGINSAIQTQLSGKADTSHTHALGDITSGFGTGVATFLATPSSSNLASAVTGETGSGALVFGTSPTISTPALTLSTTTSTTAGRLARTGGAIRMGDGSAALTFSDDSVIASTYAPLASPTFTGTVTLPSTTSVGNVSSTELSYLDGVTSALQTQLDGKQATITGGATSITSSNLTASRALASDASGKVAVSAVTSAELGHVAGVTSAIQTQIDNKANASNPTISTAVTVTGSTANLSMGRTDGTSATPYIDFNSGTTATDYDSRIIATGGNGTTGNGTLQILAGSLSLPSTTSIGNVSSTELGYLDGVTSALQTQLDGKQATITGGATSITSSNLTASRALASDASGKVAVSAVTSTELGHVAGVTSALQTQLDGKSPTAGSTSITTVGTVTTATSPTAAGSKGLRNITISTSEPTGGADGDVWLVYV